MSNYQKYYDEGLKRLTADVNEMAAQRKKNDAAAKDQYNQGVDTAAQTASGVYQQRIDEAPAVFQEQYDANHINELINRKKVQESMANMGLTDSGLNRSQQTALSVQRGNADAATRQQQHAYVTAARQAIDQIMAEAATKKQQYGASVDQATNNWMTEAMLSARQTADNNANARVIADQEAETKRIQAQYEAMTKQQEALAKQSTERNKAILSLMSDDDNPRTYEQASAMVGAAYPTGDTKTDTYNVAYISAIENGYDYTYAQIAATAASKGQNADAAIMAQAKKEVESAGVDTGKLTKFYGGRSGFEDFFTSESADRVDAIRTYDQSKWNTSVQRIAEKAIQNAATKEMSDFAKEYAAAVATGQTLAKIRDTYDGMSENQKAQSVSLSQIATLIRNALSTQFTGAAFEAAVTAACIEAQ